MKTPKTVAIVGATSTIAHGYARLLLKDDVGKIILVGRNPSKLADVASDLSCRKESVTIETKALDDFCSPGEIAAAVNDICVKTVPDLVLIAQGSSLPENAELQQDLPKLKASLELNAVSPLLFAESFATHLAKAGHGTLAVIGSVAGDRGRQSNYIYGAAKGCIEIYLEGLRHRFFASSIKICLIKPGPTVSPLTAGMDSGKLATVEETAGAIAKGLKKGKKVIYAPGKWALIMLIIRNIPDFIFGHLKI